MVGVTKPEFFLKLRDGGADEGLAVKWTCHERTEQGDVALLYRTEISDIAHLFLIDSHNHELWEDATRSRPATVLGTATQRLHTHFEAQFS